MSNLLEALWIIYQRGGNFNKEELELRSDYDDKELMWPMRVQHQMQYHGYNEQSFQPEFISYEEEMTPFSVINQLFEDHDLFDIKQQLDRWCQATIANHWEYAVMVRQAMVSIMSK